MLLAGGFGFRLGTKMKVVRCELAVQRGVDGSRQRGAEERTTRIEEDEGCTTSLLLLLLVFIYTTPVVLYR